jgi:hypothetical protein
MKQAIIVDLKVSRFNSALLEYVIDKISLKASNVKTCVVSFKYMSNKADRDDKS